MPHLKKCPSITHDELISYVDNYETQSRKTPVDDRNSRLCQHWTLYLVKNNVALRSVNSSSFAQLTKEIHPGWKCPDWRVFSRKYLPAISQMIETKMESSLKDKGGNCLSIEFDHWSDSSGRSFLGVLLTFTGGDRYSRSLVDVSLEGHSAERTLPILISSIEDIPVNFVNSIVSDSASACKLTRELFVKHLGYQRVIQHRCLAHLLNRMGLNFSQNEHLKSSIDWASRPTSCLTRDTRALAILREMKIRRPEKACVVRWYSTINMLESIIRLKENILDESLITCESRMTDDTHWTNITRAVNILRPSARCIAEAEKKASTVGRTIKFVLEFGKEVFASEWAEPLTVEAVVSFVKFFGPTKLGKEEFSLLRAAYAIDRRNNCD